MNGIEEVKKVCWASNVLISDRLAKEICQLFPQPLSREEYEAEMFHYNPGISMKKLKELVDKKFPQPLDDKELRREIDRIFDGCYSKDLSVCPNHTIFQCGKAINELVDLLCIVDVEARIKEIEDG